MSARSQNRAAAWRRAAGVLCLIAMVLVAPAAEAADDPLVLGVFPRRNASETTRLFTPMANYLGERLGCVFKIKI